MFLYYVILVFINSICLNLGTEVKNCHVTCELPECYCQHDLPPGGLLPQESPQIIHFTYTGAITPLERDAITNLFPDKLKNPNGCPVSITLFVVSQGSDDCLVHKLYVRGHEIALAGMNRTGSTTTTEWGETEWERAIEEQRIQIVDKSRVAQDHVVGMRAQRQKPGGDPQFSMLFNLGYEYDSTLQAGPHSELSDQQFYPWPFTLDTPFQELGFVCKNWPCPVRSYVGFWEIPVVPLIGPSRACAYLDDCIFRMRLSDEVANLLYRHFRFVYTGNRAPLQINIQPKTLRSQIAVEGIEKFIKLIVERDDTWIVSMGQSIAWMRDPVPNRLLIDEGAFHCDELRPYRKCSSGDNNRTTVNVTLREVLNVEEIWIWQTVILVVLYVVFFRYDRMKQKERKNA